MSEFNPALNKITDKKSFFIIGVFFGLLVILSLTFYILSNSRGNPTGGQGGIFNIRPSSNQSSPNVTKTPTNTSSMYPPPPKLTTDSWTMSLSTTPSDVVASQQYTFKQNYSSEEVRNFVNKLFYPQKFDAANNQVIAYSLNSSTKDTQALKFDTRSGMFAFISTVGLSVPEAGSTDISNDAIYTFLKSLDLYDPTIQVTARYSTAVNPGLTYVELHRDWRKAGLPILNFVGLLNLPETQKMTGLSLSSSVGSVPDPNIINTTDGRNGLARQKDFNTMTIVINSKNNKIVAIESNLRRIVTSKNTTSNLISYAEAEDKLKNNDYEMSFVAPAGEGSTDWDTVYPGNIASASDTTITDSAYAYLEQSPATLQTALKPYVVFRGYATLKNGYRSSFIAAVPAEQKGVMGASTTSESTQLLAQSQQQENTTNPTGQPVTTIPVPTANPACTYEHVRIAPFDRAISFMGITLVHAPYFEYQKFINDHWNDWYREENGGHGDWYYIPPENFNSGQLASDLEKIKQNLITFMNAIGYTGGEGFRIDEHTGNWTAIWNDVNNGWGDERNPYNWNARCPIRFTGHSPALFIYGKPGQSVQVIPSDTLYVDPSLVKNSWNVTINHPFDLTVNGVSRPYLYYEYSSITFNKPKTGWVINRNELQVFAEKISQQLGLNGSEKERLALELINGATKLPNNKVYIGLIDVNEVDRKLPLKFSPQPQKIYRYHFYISPANGKVTVPRLTPLQRSEFMAVEIGVFTAQ